MNRLNAQQDQRFDRESAENSNRIPSKRRITVGNRSNLRDFENSITSGKLDPTRSLSFVHSVSHMLNRITFLFNAANG
jgi:hypothetical protein